MQLSLLTKQQCGKVNTQIRQNILPKLWLNRNMPGAVIYGPLEHGGMKIIENYTLQDKLQVPNLIKHLKSGERGQ